MSLGYIILLIAFMVTAFSIWAGVSGIKLKKKSLIQAAKLTVYGQFYLITLSIILLTYAFLVRDFSFRYVAEYSDRTLPFLYTISSVWAGQAGSLLFWTWLLTIFGALFIFVNRNREHDLHPYVITIHSSITIFFMSLVIFSTNPFEKLSRVLPDGFGLNPLLQNIGMIFHPPTLFLGFVGFTIPFAFALATLMKGEKSNEWLDQSRNWSLFAWIMLTIGNLLGAQWAYVELGWGGYWAWDPVENASLLPWLTGTAFIHSIMAQKTRGMLKTWNISLAVATFLLTIMGTFITRSGIISSVHAFGKSNMGTFFLIFMGIIITVSIGLIIWRKSILKSEGKIDAFISREFSFLFNNMIFVVLTITILWGTLYPAITELFIGKQITLGENFFNKISVPFGIVLFLLIAVCPLLIWHKTKNDTIKKRAIFSFSTMILFMIILFIAGIKHLNSLIILGTAFLTLAVILSELFVSAGKRKASSNENIFKATGKILRLNPRKYAAYLIHLGVAMIFIAIVGTTVYKQEKQITLKKGESTTIGKYTLVYKSMSEESDERKDVLYAHLDVLKSDKKIGELTPQKHLYKGGIGEKQVTSEVDFKSNLVEDLYISIASYQNDESATFVIMLNPLQNWMWIGGAVMTLGIIIILANAFKKQKQKNKKTSGQKSVKKKS